MLSIQWSVELAWALLCCILWIFVSQWDLFSIKLPIHKGGVRDKGTPPSPSLSLCWSDQFKMNRSPERFLTFHFPLSKYAVDPGACLEMAAVWCLQGSWVGTVKGNPTWGDPQVSYFILNSDRAVQGHTQKVNQWPTIWFLQFGGSDFERLCILCSLVLPELPQASPL